MIVILDGPDGVGKSTLAKKLQEEFNIDSYIHLTGKDPRDYAFYKTMLGKTDVIFDRSFMSEPIYSSVLEREQCLTHEELQDLYEIVDKNGIIVIICLADRADIKYHDNENPIIIQNQSVITSYFLHVALENSYYIAYPLAGGYSFSNLADYIKNRS